MSTHEPNRMTSWGVGPKFAIISLVLGLLLIFANYYFFPKLLLAFNEFMFWFGTGVVAFGFYLMFLATFQVHQAFNQGRLITGGIYAYIRNPVYAAWILFIVPGLFLATGVSFLIIMPFIMYVLIRKLIIEEEQYLEQKFGKVYLDYKNAVNSIVPKMSRERNAQ